MRIKIWGSRGSLPTPGRETLEHGGNTTCLEIRLKSGRLIIIDAGSGLRPLGNHLFRDDPETTNLCLMMTHFHWDHLMGFPFFKPAYFSKYKITVCGGPKLQPSLREALVHQMKPPYFPVDFSIMKADIRFGCEGNERPCSLDARIDHIALNHPNGGYGYRFTEGGKTFVFLTDNEISYEHEGGLPREDYVEFCRGADVLIHDSQYTDEEYKITRGWGHSTYADATDVAIEAGVKSFGLYHHDQERSDKDLELHAHWCRERIKAAGSDVECFISSEGMVIDL